MDLTLVLSAVGRHGRCAREGRLRESREGKIGGCEWFGWAGEAAAETGGYFKSGSGLSEGKEMGSDLGAPAGGFPSPNHVRRARFGACLDPWFSHVFLSKP